MQSYVHATEKHAKSHDGQLLSKEERKQFILDAFVKNYENFIQTEIDEYNERVLKGNEFIHNGPCSWMYDNYMSYLVTICNIGSKNEIGGCKYIDETNLIKVYEFYNIDEKEYKSTIKLLRDNVMKKSNFNLPDCEKIMQNLLTLCMKHVDSVINEIDTQDMFIMAVQYIFTLTGFRQFKLSNADQLAITDFFKENKERFDPKLLIKIMQDKFVSQCYDICVKANNFNPEHIKTVLCDLKFFDQSSYKQSDKDIDKIKLFVKLFMEEHCDIYKIINENDSIWAYRDDIVGECVRVIINDNIIDKAYVTKKVFEKFYINK